jgi:hypothetical protein
VAAPPQTLEPLVRDELRGPVQAIVRQVVVELVREHLNGAAEATQLQSKATNGPVPASDQTPASTGRKTYRICGETKPASAFEAGRHQRDKPLVAPAAAVYKA